MRLLNKSLTTLILRSRSYGDDMIVNTRAVRRLIVVLSGFTDVSEISRLLLSMFFPAKYGSRQMVVD